MLRLPTSRAILMRPASRGSTQLFVVGFAVAILLCVSTEPGQIGAAATHGLTDQAVADYQDSGADLIQLLSRASNKFKIPLGIELNKELPHQIVSVHIAKGSVADLFSVIVDKAPGYKWVEQDGVVDILPREHADGMLDLHISRFAVKDATSIQVREAIDALPEVEIWFKQNGVVDQSPIDVNVFAPTRGRLALPRVSLRLHDVTLRGVLNRIVRKPPLNGWTVSRYGNRAQYLNVQIY
jgi:hypothetical protein